MQMLSKTLYKAPHLLIFLVICFILNSSFFSNVDIEERYLQGKIHPRNPRYQTMKIALELLEKRKPRVLVETGTAREGDRGFGTETFIGDGGSTLIFAQWAKAHGSQLYTVDINQEAINKAKAALIARDTDQNVHFACSDSVEFLENFNQKIDFLYLDSFDFDFNDPLPSQTHHLHEIVKALPLLSKNSVVMIDDCDLPSGGKGGLAIPYLLENGWRVYAQGYQMIFVRE